MSYDCDAFFQCFEFRFNLRFFFRGKKKFTVGQQRCDFRHFFDVRRKVADSAVAELCFFFDKIKNFRSCGIAHF